MKNKLIFSGFLTATALLTGVTVRQNVGDNNLAEARGSLISSSQQLGQKFALPAPRVETTGHTSISQFANPRSRKLGSEGGLANLKHEAYIFPGSHPSGDPLLARDYGAGSNEGFSVQNYDSNGGRGPGGAGGASGGGGGSGGEQSANGNSGSNSGDTANGQSNTDTTAQLADGSSGSNSGSGGDSGGNSGGSSGGIGDVLDNNFGGNGHTNGSGGAVQVPEPGMFGLMGLGVLAVAMARRRKQRRTAAA
jgi:PEP-CTERM motif